MVEVLCAIFGWTGRQLSAQLCPKWQSAIIGINLAIEIVPQMVHEHTQVTHNKGNGPVLQLDLQTQITTQWLCLLHFAFQRFVWPANMESISKHCKTCSHNILCAQQIIVTPTQKKKEEKSLKYMMRVGELNPVVVIEHDKLDDLQYTWETNDQLHVETSNSVYDCGEGGVQECG